MRRATAEEAIRRAQKKIDVSAALAAEADEIAPLSEGEGETTEDAAVLEEVPAEALPVQDTLPLEESPAEELSVQEPVTAEGTPVEEVTTEELPAEEAETVGGER